MNSFLVSQSLKSVATKSLLPSIFVPSSLSNPVCLQCVRWRKKPRWLPVAKTKMYKIPPKVKHPKEENEELLNLFNSYRTSMKAIRLYFSEKTKSQTTAPEVIAEQLRLLQEDHDNCIAINDEWNKNVAKIREERMALEANEKKLRIMEQIAEIEKKEEEEMKNIEEIVRSMKEQSATFITPENIDEAIEKALCQTVDYNFCIDLKGNIYRGLRARPGVSEPDKPLNTGGDTTVKQAVSQ